MPLKKLHRIMSLWFRLHGLLSAPKWLQSRILNAVSLSLFLAAPTLIVVPAYAAELTEWRFDPETRQLELLVPGGTTPNYFLLAQPARIVLDLPNTVVDSVLEEQSFSGVVRSIRVSQFQPNLTRIVIELAPDAELAPSQVELRQISVPNVSGRERWVVRPLLAGDPPVATIEPVPTIPAPEGVNEPSDIGGVTFEANGRSPEASSGSSSVLAPDNEVLDAGVNQPEDDSDTSTSESSVEVSQSDSRESDGELPPLEPGAFEIPVEIPPPLSGVETSPLPESIASEPEAQSERTDDDMNLPLPVAIAPPATDNSERLEESDASSPEDDALSEEPNALSEEDVETETPDPLATAFDSDDADSGSSTSETVRITARTPEELQQALAEALPPGTEITIVDGNDDRSNSDANRDDESLPESLQQSPEQVTSLEPENTQPENTQPEGSSDDETTTDRETSLATVNTPTLLDDSDPVGQSRTQDDTPTTTSESEADFPSPQENTVSDVSATPIAPDALSAIPPAQVDDADDGPIPVSISEVNEEVIEPSPAENPEQALPMPMTVSRASDSSVNSINNRQPIDVQPPSSTESEGIESEGIESEGIESEGIESEGIESEGIESEGIESDVFSVPSTLPTETSQGALGLSPERQLIVAAQPGAMIPSGTVLRLRYPRLTPTLLQKGIAWQDVLLLEQTLFDRSGNMIAPEGTQIIGRFEIAPQQIRFVTQAIALDGRNIPLQAVSGWVPVSTESQAVVIRPNQIVNVRLAEHFDR